MNDKNDELYLNVSDPVMGQPETCGEIIHKYGTYEIQPTADTENTFPTISQGLPSDESGLKIDKKDVIKKRENDLSDNSADYEDKLNKA